MTMTSPDRLQHETTELLQHLIRNACINTGDPGSGQEYRSAEMLQAYLEGSGLDMELYEPRPGRASLVARIEGWNPDAPTLMLMGHTDVVPATGNWDRDPFGGELVDGYVWGRGAIDMLNLTASMAVTTRNLARNGFKPEGTLIYLAVADEEEQGDYGANWLVKHQRDAVRADMVITESGGFPIDTPTGLRLPIIVGEKGCYWATLRIRGTAGHGSQPYRSDNALVKAAEVVRRIDAFRPETQIHETWKRFLNNIGYPQELVAPLLDPAPSFYDALEFLPDGIARQFHACTHTTITPTMISGGTKINTIPDSVDLQIDVRTLPGQSAEEIEAMLGEILGEDLAGAVQILSARVDESTQSPIDTPLWDTLTAVSQSFHEGAVTVPYLTVGATDARFFRRIGATAYGFGMFSRQLTFEAYAAMFHGDNERVDVESLRLSTEMWDAVVRRTLG